MTYKYEIPEGRKVIIPSRHWNKYYANRGRKLVTHTEAYVTENRVVFHHLISPLGKFIFLLILPFVFIFGVLSDGVRETVDAVLDVFLQKKRGAFTSDDCWNNDSSSSTWNKTMEMINTL